MKGLLVLLSVIMLGGSALGADAKPKKLGFREALIEAAEQEREAGRLKTRQVIALRIASLNPKVCERMQNEVVSRAIKAGKMPISATSNIGAFDFTALLEFFKQILPLLLQLFSLLAQDMMQTGQTMLVLDDMMLDDYAWGGRLLRAMRPCNWPVIRQLPAATIRRERLYGTPEIERPIWNWMQEGGACRGGICPA